MNEAEQQQQQSEKAQQTAGIKPHKKNAHKSLRHAIAEKVCVNSEQIAETMVRGAIKGDPRITKMVIDTLKPERKSRDRKAARVSEAGAELVESRAMGLAGEAQCTADDEEALEKAEADRAGLPTGSQT